MSEEKFSIGKRIRSFKYAFNGIKIMLVEEHNSRIHLLAVLIVVTAGFYFKVSHIEWFVLKKLNTRDDVFDGHIVQRPISQIHLPFIRDNRKNYH